MFAGYVRTENVLGYTNASKAADWRKGMLESIANLVVSHGTAEGVREGSWGIILGFKEKSLAEHFYQNQSSRMFYQGTGDCKIVSVTDLSEEQTEEYIHDTFNGSTVQTQTGVQGKVTCEHGVTGMMFYKVSLGELIYTIASKV